LKFFCILVAKSDTVVFRRLSDHSGLFNFLRQQCNGQNPHLAEKVKVSASHFFDEYFREWNLLDWGTSNGWSGGSVHVNGQWIDFDLLGRSFTLNGISIYTRSWYIPQRWSLLSSDGSDNFETICESIDDTQFYCNSKSKDIFLPIQNTKPFKRFRILAKSDAIPAGSRKWFCLCSIEFYGILNL
jgi:hypothetical protein